MSKRKDRKRYSNGSRQDYTKGGRVGYAQGDNVDQEDRKKRIADTATRVEQGARGVVPSAAVIPDAEKVGFVRREVKQPDRPVGPQGPRGMEEPLRFDGRPSSPPKQYEMVRDTSLDSETTTMADPTKVDATQAAQVAPDSYYR